jgi:hypothetical protein
MMQKYVGLALCLVFLLFACAPQDVATETVTEPTDAGTASSGRATATPSQVQLTPFSATRTPAELAPTPTTMETVEEREPTVTVAPGLGPLVDQVVADLAKRLGVDPADIEVVEATSAEWRDGSLGCPQPGMVYTQVLQDGALIRLRAGTEEYNYHSGRNRPPFLCERAQEETKVTAVPVTPTPASVEVEGTFGTPVPLDPTDSAVAEMVTQAKADLAQRLSVSPEEITLVDVEAVVWRDGSLGCPQPGMMYIQVLKEGARIRLSVGDEVFHYHSDGSQPPFLCEKPS